MWEYPWRSNFVRTCTCFVKHQVSDVRAMSQTHLRKKIGNWMCSALDIYIYMYAYQHEPCMKDEAWTEDCYTQVWLVCVLAVSIATDYTVRVWWVHWCKHTSIDISTYIHMCVFWTKFCDKLTDGVGVAGGVALPVQIRFPWSWCYTSIWEWRNKLTEPRLEEDEYSIWVRRTTGY